MPYDAQLIFADHVGRFYARQYAFPPMAGRLLGYLFVCDPPQPTIDELGEALLASRSAITGAVKLLEGYQIARRTRIAGERMDRVSLDPSSQQPQNFDSAVHVEHAALFREGLALLVDAPRNAAPRSRKWSPSPSSSASGCPSCGMNGRSIAISCGQRVRYLVRSLIKPSRVPAAKRIERRCRMDESELRARADNGDIEAIDELIELATGRGDLGELRRLSDRGSRTATDELIQLAGELQDVNELRRLADRGESDAIDELVQLGAELGDTALLRSLADAGSADAADQLIELATESDDLDELRRLADNGNVTAAEVLAELTAE